MTGRPVLLFGFEPFLQFKENPSERIVKELNGTMVAGRKIVGRILPVDYDRVEGMIMEEIRKNKPSIVLGTGLAAGRSLLSVEKIAVNYKGSEEADNNGRKANGTQIDANAPDGLFSTINVEEAVATLNGKGVPATVSLSAGSYLCNYAMFVIVRESRRKEFRGGFVHLPCDERMASSNEYRRYPFMTLGSMKKGVRTVIECAAEGE